MKKILFVFIILSGIFVPAICEAIQIESEYQSSYGNVLFLNNYHYNYAFQKGWFFNHSGFLSQSRNKRFNRYSRNADLGWNITKEEAPFLYTLHLDFNEAVDKARPEAERYEIDKTRRQVGLEIMYNPADSVYAYSGLTYIRTDESNSRYSDKVYHSDGYRSNSNIRFVRFFDNADMSFDTFFNLQHLDYDFARSYGADVSFDVVRPVFDTDLSFRRERTKIYLLNDEVDTHIRSLYQASVVYRSRITQDLHLVIGDRFVARDNRLRERQDRNYLETDNSLFTNTVYHWGEHFRFYLSGLYRLFSRSFKDEHSSRDQEQRSFSGSVSYFFSERDSLVYHRKIDLTRTDYTLSTNILDNDQRIDEQQVSLYLYLRERMKLTNHFSFIRREETYLKSGMSANNKVTRIYNLLPSLQITFNSNLLLLQEYHLRADYDDFVFDTDTRDRMYRRFSATYTLLTGLPWVSGYSYHIRDREDLYFSHDFVTGLTYKYDTNSSGNKIEDAYEIFAENEYHTLQFEIFRRIRRLELRFRPRFIWSNIRYEFNHMFEFAYLFPDRKNYITININSTGTSVEEFLWRVNALVNISF